MQQKLGVCWLGRGQLEILGPRHDDVHDDDHDDAHDDAHDGAHDDAHDDDKQ